MGRGHRALLSLLLAGFLCQGGLELRAAPPPAPTVTPSVQATPAFGPKPVFVSPGNPTPFAGPELPPGRGRFRAAMMDGRAPGEGGGTVAERLARMTPEEREAYKHNLHLWQQLPPEERQAMRQLVNERNREEVLNALKESGLQLNDDQREIFRLRYLQERRKLEREILEQANAERTRRLPEMLERLRREFAPPKPVVLPGPASAAGGSPGQH